MSLRATEAVRRAAAATTQLPSRLLEDAIALAPELYRFAAAATRDHHAAEDIVQETLWRAQSEQDDISDARAWCFTVTLNLARSYFRRRRWLPLRQAERTEGWDFVQRLAEHESVHRTLGKLSRDQRTSLLLQVLGGFAIAEIADIEATTEAAVKQRLYRARIAFRRAYKGEEE